MSVEKIILYLTWIISSVSFWLFIPKDKRRNAQVAFLFKQVLTWVLGLLVVEMGWIEFPIRLLSNATKASFTFDFLVYPVICAFFNVYYPEKHNKFIKLLYYAAYCSAMTGVEVILINTTNLIKYLHWSWYWTWLSIFVTLYISRIYYRWFFRINNSY